MCQNVESVENVELKVYQYVENVENVELKVQLKKLKVAPILLVASLLGRNSACGESWAAVLLVASLLGRNSACGEPPWS